MSSQEARAVLVEHIAEIEAEGNPVKRQKIEATVVIVENWLRAVVQEEVRNASISR